MLFRKQQDNNTALGAELIVLLKLLEVIEREGKYVSRGKIQIGFNNWVYHRKIASKIGKSSAFVHDIGVEIAQMQSIMKNAKVKIEIALVKGCKNSTAPH